jgi:hypothetical protein
MQDYNSVYCKLRVFRYQIANTKNSGQTGKRHSNIESMLRWS